MEQDQPDSYPTHTHGRVIGRRTPPADDLEQDQPNSAADDSEQDTADSYSVVGRMVMLEAGHNRLTPSEWDAGDGLGRR